MRLETQVIEIEPGWVFVKFKGPRPPDESRPFWLHKSLTDWLAINPGRAVTRTLPLVVDGRLEGVHVWLGEPPAPRPDVPMRLHPRLIDRMPREHVEALCQHAYEIWFQHPAAPGALAIVSRGGNAVVFDRASETGYVVPFDELEGLDDPTKENYAAWRASGETNYFVIHLPGGYRGDDG